MRWMTYWKRRGRGRTTLAVTCGGALSPSQERCPAQRPGVAIATPAAALPVPPLSVLFEPNLAPGAGEHVQVGAADEHVEPPAGVNEAGAGNDVDFLPECDRVVSVAGADGLAAQNVREVEANLVVPVAGGNFQSTASE